MTSVVGERITLDGPSGALEAIVEEPSGMATGYAVVCHPHPLFGGTMENKVVTSMARALRDSGMATIRFNFRGVGASDGVFDGGLGETADARCAAEWGARRWDGGNILIAGFSFGAFVALRLAQEVAASRLITVAPPVDHFDFTSLAVPTCPWLVVQGDADEVVDPHKAISWVNGLDPRPSLVVMHGVGHFFHGRLTELRTTVTSAVRGG